jgi:acyl-CoA synthetase (AMP-forming)/AMP-acid ligase II
MLTTSEMYEVMISEGDVALYKLDEWAEKAPAKTFLYYGETGLSLSYADVKRRSDALAAGLAALGVERGDRVSVLTRNSLAAALAVFAIWRCGGVYAPHNFNLRGKLLSYQINDTAPKVLLADTSMADQLSGVHRLHLWHNGPGEGRRTAEPMDQSVRVRRPVTARPRRRSLLRPAPLPRRRRLLAPHPRAMEGLHRRAMEPF